MERPDFVTGEMYHIYSRGVERRKVFLDDRDFLRFVVGLYEFNSVAPAINAGRSFSQQPIEVRLQSRRGNPLVEILTFCLMPNHYHLMVRQLVDHGITAFMRKLGTGYTNYFNLKYQRVGPLFQGVFRAVLLAEQAHFTHLPHYIHLNPLELRYPDWRERGVGNMEDALEYLKNYRWSSLPDYLGQQNFPTVTERGFLRECLGGPEECLGQISEWIRAPNSGAVEGVTLDLGA